MQALPTHDHLLERLQIGAAELRHIVHRRDSFYVKRVVKRRSRNRPRIVYEVRDGLRRIHRIIAVMLREDLAQMHDCVNGFRKRRSIKTHAAPHCAARLVAVADIQAFFASITEDRVWDLFVRLGASVNVAMTMARLTTLYGILPEGPRSSPAIANLIGQDLDQVILSELPLGCRYTRYADDLAFSGDHVPSEESVSRWASTAGFTLKPTSYSVRHRLKGPYVTGLFVGSETPRIPRKRRRMIERTLYYLAKEDKAQALKAMRNDGAWRKRSDSSRLIGLTSTIESISAVEPELAQVYRTQLDAILRGK
jgi:RNA-directed DNA polymerase